MDPFTVILDFTSVKRVTIVQPVIYVLNPHQVAMNRELDRAGRVAVAQMLSGNNMEANFDAVSRLTKKAALLGASMIFFPECFNFMGLKGREAAEIAQPLDGREYTRDESFS